MRGVWLLGVLFAGCTEVANPRSCVDGSCTDSQFPYCDLEGLIEQPKTCVAVGCEPGSFKACRDDRAITCNTTGNNFDLVECPFGCGPNGCIPPPDEVDCLTNDQCANPAPICGASMTCRGCSSNDECASTVCELDTGACTAETAIVFAAPTGSTTSDCTLAEPCALARAATRSATTIGSTLRLLPGSYTESFNVDGNVIVKVVATGAKLVAPTKMTVTGGATVNVRDLEITTTGESTLMCGDVSVAIPKSTLYLENVVGALEIDRCSVTMRGGEIRGLTIDTGATLDADGVRVTYPFARTLGAQVSVRFINSIFDNAVITLANNDQVAPGSTLSVAFSTFVYRTSGYSFNCNVNNSGYVRTERFENNIFVGTPDTGLPAVYSPGACLFANNITFPQSTPVPGGNTIADPQFENITMKDYRLKLGSPAINTAVPSTGLTTSRDFDGVARPQGAAHDIGAFERLP